MEGKKKIEFLWAVKWSTLYMIVVVMYVQGVFFSGAPLKSFFLTG
jgi:hypothetical protein